MQIAAIRLYQGIYGESSKPPVRFNMWTSTIATNEYRLQHLVLRDAYAWNVPTCLGRYLHHSITRKISRRVALTGAFVSYMPYTRESASFDKMFYKRLRLTPFAFAFEVQHDHAIG